MKLFVTLVGLILVFESIPYVAAPLAMQRWLKQLVEANPEQLRVLGLLALGCGLLLCYFAQRSSLFG